MASPLGMLGAVAIEHGDQFLGNGEGGFKVDDSCNRQQYLHQQRAHGCLDLFPRAVQEELSALLREPQYRTLSKREEGKRPHLQEHKPLLQFLHREHLDSDEAHALYDGDDGG